VSSSGLSCRRRSDGLLVSDWVRSASGAALEEVCRDDLLGEEGGELIVVVARPSTALPKQPACNQLCRFFGERQVDMDMAAIMSSRCSEEYREGV
jgi:hypothetical protein